MKHFSFLILLMASTAFASGPFDSGALGTKHWNGQTADYGRGGTGIAVYDSTHVAVRNPANLCGGRLTRFQVGFSGTRTNLSTPSDAQITSGGHFDTWSLTFPLLYRDVSMGLNLRPISSVDMHVAASHVDASDREYVESLNGSGGLSLASMTFARPFPKWNVRVGLEIGLLFGSLLDDWKVFYPAAAPPYDSWIERRQSFLAFHSRFGLQVQPTSALAFGVVLTPPRTADRTIDIENKGNNLDTELGTDQVELPFEAAFGLSYNRYGVDWLIDLEWTDAYSDDLGLPAEAIPSNSMGVAFGVELPLDGSFDAPFLRRVVWRAGLRIQDQPVRFQNMTTGVWDDVQDRVFTFGVGLPLKAHGTWLDLGFEIGQKGSEGTHGLEESYVGMRMGLTARDLWFWRPTY